MIRSIAVTLIATSLLLALLSGCQSESSQTVIKMAHSLDNKHPVHLAMEHLDKRLQEISGGKMRVDIYPSGQLGSERETIELLQIGSLGMTKVSASPMEGFVPEMKVFNLPYLFEDYDHFWRVLKSDVGKRLLVAGEDFNLRGLGYYDAGSRSFYSTERKITSPEDLNGMKVRVMNSQTAVDMINTMGGSATPISFGELYTSLQQGVVDAAENNPPSFYLSRHYEVSKYYTIDEHTSIPDIVLISKYVWDTLSTQEQEWLQQAMDESVDYQRTLWKKASDEAMEAVRKAGVEIIYPDKSLFSESVSGIYESVTNPKVIQTIEDIKQLASQQQ